LFLSSKTPMGTGRTALLSGPGLNSAFHDGLNNGLNNGLTPRHLASQYV
jgi:hypothetical protein